MGVARRCPQGGRGRGLPYFEYTNMIIKKREDMLFLFI
jgi:hypothetical protein